MTKTQAERARTKNIGTPTSSSNALNGAVRTSAPQQPMLNPMQPIQMPMQMVRTREWDAGAALAKNFPLIAHRLCLTEWWLQFPVALLLPPDLTSLGCRVTKALELLGVAILKLEGAHLAIVHLNTAESLIKHEPWPGELPSRESCFLCVALGEESDIFLIDKRPCRAIEEALEGQIVWKRVVSASICTIQGRRIEARFQVSPGAVVPEVR